VTAQQALGQQLQSFGETLIQAGGTLYDRDARIQADQAEIDLSAGLEEFSRYIMSNPTLHGTPNAADPLAGDGFMAMWKDKRKELEDRIAGITNPRAKERVAQTFAQLADAQATKVYSIQREAWEKSAKVQRLNGIDTYIESSADPAEATWAFTNSSIAEMETTGMIGPEERATLQASRALWILKRDINKTATAAFKEGGLGAAEAAIASYGKQLPSADRVHGASPELKEATLQDIRVLAAAVDRQAIADYKNMEANTLLALAKGKSVGPVLTESTIEGWTSAQGFKASTEARAAAKLSLTGLVDDKAEAILGDAYANYQAAFPGGMTPEGYSDAVRAIKETTVEIGGARYSPSAGVKERAIKNLGILTNGAATAEGTAQKNLGNSLFAILDDAAERLKGAAATGAAKVTMAFPEADADGNIIMVTRDITWETWDAIRNQPTIAIALMASGKAEALTAKFNSRAKASGVWDAVKADKDLKDIFANQAQKLEIERFMATPEGQAMDYAKAKQYVQDYHGKQYSVDVQFLTSASFKGDRYKDSIDLFAQDMRKERFKYAAANGRITNGLFEKAYTKGAVEVQRYIENELKLEIQGGLYTIDPEGKLLFTIKNPASAAPPRTIAGTGYSLPDTVSRYLITLDVVGAQGDARYIRTLTYQGGLSVVEAWEPSLGTGGEWVAVVEAGAGPDGYYIYKDPAAIDKARKASTGVPENYNPYGWAAPAPAATPTPAKPAQPPAPAAPSSAPVHKAAPLESYDKWGGKH